MSVGTFSADEGFPRPWRQPGGPLTFLELGCGNGYVVDRVRQLHPDWRLVGTDLFEEGLTNARRRMPAGVELQQIDATRLPYEAEFDVVGAFDVIEHIKIAPAVLAGMYRATEPGGGLLITVPQHKWMWSSWRLRASRTSGRRTEGQVVVAAGQGS